MRGREIERLGFWLLTGFLSGIGLLFLVGPVVALVGRCPPALLASTASERFVVQTFVITFALAALAVLVIVAIGYPIAYLLARTSFPGQNIVRALLEIPVLLPHTVSGIALLALFGRHGPCGPLISTLGLSVLDSWFGALLAMAFVSAPFFIRPLEEAIRSLDPELELVARSLGAGPMRTFLRITLPLTARSAVAGAILAWARAISEFGAVVILTYNKPMVAAVLVYDRFTTGGLSASLPVSALLALTSIAIFLTLITLTKRLWAPLPRTTALR